MNGTPGLIVGIALVAVAGVSQRCVRAAGLRVPSPGGVVMAVVGLSTAVPAAIHMTF